MVAIIIIVLLILLLRNMSASNKSGSVPTKVVAVPVSSCGSAGENFTSGSGVVAGVHEPPTPVHCQHIVVGQFGGYSGLPIHVTYPVAPPPIKILTPVPVRSYPRPAPMPVRPIYRAALPSPAACITCTFGLGGGGGFGRGGTGGICGVGGSADIMSTY